MAGRRTHNRALWIGPAQTDHDTDPDATGASHLHMPATELGELKVNRTPIPTNYKLNTEDPTAPDYDGPKMWSIDGIKVPLIGLPTAAGDGVAASASDWLDALLTLLCGSTDTTTGETVSAVGGATDITLATDILDVGDPMLLYESGVPDLERGQWNLVTVDVGAGQYTIAPGFQDFGTSPPTAAAVSYGVKFYYSDGSTVPSTRVFYYEDDTDNYALLGGQIVDPVIEVPAGGGMCTLSFNLRGSGWSNTTKGSVPAAAGATPSATKALKSPVIYNGAVIDTPSVSITLNRNPVQVPSTAGCEGVVGDETTNNDFRITVTPDRTDARRDLVADGATTSTVFVSQIGKATLSGGVVNGVAFLAPDVNPVDDGDPQDDGGRGRFQINLQVNRSSSTGVTAWMIARA